MVRNLHRTKNRFHGNTTLATVHVKLGMLRELVAVRNTTADGTTDGLGTDVWGRLRLHYHAAFAGRDAFMGLR